MAEMMARFSQPGVVRCILLRPARRAGMVAVEAARVLDRGLEGDHARPGKRAVTLIQAEHLPVIAALAGRDGVAADELRRNIVISGLNLSGFRDKRVRVGAAVLELTVPAHPCSRMEEVLGHGGYTAMRGHGGFCAQVIAPGEVRVGDSVVPV